MIIDKDWKYREILEHAEALKSEYNDILASFLWHEGRKKAEYMDEVKTLIYSLKIEEWRRNKIWEYFNDDIELPILTKYI